MNSSADYLKQLRKSHHMSQTQMASFLFISRQTYSSYERGLRKVPPDILHRFSAMTEWADTEMSDSLRFTELSPQERRMILEYRALDDSGKRQILMSLAAELQLTSLLTPACDGCV